MIGEQLALNPNIVLMCRGIKRGDKSTSPDDCGTDFHIISGAIPHIQRQDRETRIEMVVNTKGTDELFFEGRIISARGKTPQARRFNFVSKADALIAVSGTNGTEQQLALAHALELPILPIPTLGGAAREFWLSHHDEILHRLRLTAADAIRLEGMPPSPQLAKEFTCLLAAALERRCFVIMPFANDDQLNALYDRAIATAVNSFGDRSIRLDREGLPGDVGRQIAEGIKACDYAIAVFERKNDNVFYELGQAHARDKPVIIVWNRNYAAPVPFDITMYQRIDYDAIDDDLTNRICSAIRRISSTATTS
jgi:nucleoside 2-deoxyribosyltransferase